MTSRRPATDEEARALASTLRLRILRVCLSEACTNKQIAQVRHRLRDLLDEFEQRPHDPKAPPWSLFLAVYPDPNRR